MMPVPRGREMKTRKDARAAPTFCIVSPRTYHAANRGAVSHFRQPAHAPEVGMV